MLEKVLGEVASWCLSYLIATSSCAGVGVDGLDCPLYQPTTCSRQTRGQGFLPGVILSRRAAMGGGTFLGDTHPSGLDIRGSA
jgi:hypothetical protein